MTSLLPYASRPRSFWRVFAIAFALSLLGLTCDVAAEELAAIPDAKALAEAKKLIDEVYADLLSAKSDDDRAASARVLIMRAAETNNAPAAKYMMYDTARTLAVQAGDTVAAMDAIDGLAASFENASGGFMDLAATALQDLTRKARNDTQHAAVAQAGVGVVERMVAADRHDQAMTLLTRTRNSAQRSRRPELVSAYKAMQDELRVIRDETKRIAGDLEAIKQKPDDPALNLSVGKYLSLYRNDWEAGLPLLRRSSDDALAAAAKADLAGASNAKEQVSIGDRWWATASKRPKIETRGLTERAKHWYRLALPEIKGIERAVLTKRLEPEGQVKWGDLVLEPGIQTMIEVDGDKNGARRGPRVKETTWEFRTAPPEAESEIVLHFEGYLFFPRNAEVGLMSYAAANSLSIEVNGNHAFRGNGRSEVSIYLIKGYNAIRGSIQVSVANIKNPDLLRRAYFNLSELDGKPITIPAEHWFHDVTR